jgi:hypothetical protein
LAVVLVDDPLLVDVVVGLVVDDEHPATVTAATSARAPDNNHFPRCSPMATLSPFRNLYPELVCAPADPASSRWLTPPIVGPVSMTRMLLMSTVADMTRPALPLHLGQPGSPFRREDRSTTEPDLRPGPGGGLSGGTVVDGRIP